MSVQYDEYLQQHKNAVYEAFLWMKKNIPEIFETDEMMSKVDYNIKFAHDASKENPDEYQAYDAYFYGKNRSAQVVDDFNYAWLTHIHNNPHHWQHWILHKDNPDEETICLEMPYEYIIEMICDWWSFSWNKGDLWEIFKWYDERKNHIMLNKTTRNKLETILLAMHDKLLIINISKDITGNIVKPDSDTSSQAINVPKIDAGSISESIANAVEKSLKGGFMNNLIP